MKTIDYPYNRKKISLDLKIGYVPNAEESDGTPYPSPKRGTVRYIILEINEQEREDEAIDTMMGSYSRYYS